MPGSMLNPTVIAFVPQHVSLQFDACYRVNLIRPLQGRGSGIAAVLQHRCRRVAGPHERPTKASGVDAERSGRGRPRSPYHEGLHK